MSDNPFKDPAVTKATDSKEDVQPLPASEWNKPATNPAPTTPTPAPAEADPSPQHDAENPWTKPKPAAVDEEVPSVAGRETRKRGDKRDKRKPWEIEGRTPNQQELIQWEKDLVVREKFYADSDDKMHNWPTWPAPCTRYAPDEDIVGPESESRRDWVKYLYYLWFGNVLGLFWNFCSMCAYVDSEGSDIALVFLALVYFIAGAPGAFFGWMKLGYRAAETSSNFQYLMFLIWFGLCGLFWICVAIGFPEAGMAGMIAMITVWDDSDAAGTMCLVGFILYVSLALLHLWLWYRGSRLFSESGGVEKAKQDAKKEGGKKFVQHAVGM